MPAGNTGTLSRDYYNPSWFEDDAKWDPKGRPGEGSEVWYVNEWATRWATDDVRRRLEGTDSDSDSDSRPHADDDASSSSEGSGAVESSQDGDSQSDACAGLSRSESQQGADSGSASD